MSETIISKTCSGCKQCFPLSCFAKNRSRKDGYTYYCKDCLKKYNSTDKRKAYLRNYKIEYRKTEAYKQKAKIYAQTDKGKATHRKHRQTDKGKATMSRAVNKHRLRFPDKYLAGKRLNHVIEKGNFPHVSTQLCSCGKQAEQYHHPSYDKDQRLNVIPVCAGCHRNIHREIAEVSE